MRKTLLLASVTLYITTSTDPTTNVTHIDIRQIATGGIQASPENRVLDFSERTQADKIFGNLVGRSRWTTLEGLKDVDEAEDRAWLTSGWDEEGEKVEARAVNDEAGWSMVAIWGFMEVGEAGRRYVRKMVMRNKKGKIIRDKLVYDYVGAIEA